MGQSFLLAALAFSGEPPVGAIYAVAVLGGVCMAFDNPAAQLRRRDGRPRTHQQRGQPEQRADDVVAGDRACAGGPAGVDGRLRLGVPRRRPVVPGGDRRAVDDAHERAAGRPGHAAAGVRSGRACATCAASPSCSCRWRCSALIGTLSYNFQTVFPLFVTRDLGSSDTVFTALFSVVSVGSLIGALVTARRREIRVRQVGMAAIGYGVAMAAMALAPNVAVALVLGVALGLASITFIVTSTAIVQLRSAPEMRGRVLAIQAMLFLGSTPVGGPIVGWVAEDFGARYSWARCRAAALAGVWGLAGVRRNAIARGRGAGGRRGRRRSRGHGRLSPRRPPRRPPRRG